MRESCQHWQPKGQAGNRYKLSYPVAKRLHHANLGSELRLDILQTLSRTFTLLQKYLGMLKHLPVCGLFSTPDWVDSGFAEELPLLLRVVKTCNELVETADGPDIQPGSSELIVVEYQTCVNFGVHKVFVQRLVKISQQAHSPSFNSVQTVDDDM